ncbi:hypothetical protein A3759_12850 [Thalassolituus sp. HI0120]|nr:hypothetical protein A3759_12850 [Thalassolituus sp. HI0120]
MQARATLISAAIAGFSGVALGAFGAHGLKTVLSAKMLTAWQTAVQYHLVHGAVLLALAIALMALPKSDIKIWLQRSSTMMLAGLLLFSGSLYLLALTDIRSLGMITPIGGLSWLIAWGLIAVAAFKMPVSHNEH